MSIISFNQVSSKVSQLHQQYQGSKTQLANDSNLCLLLKKELLICQRELKQLKDCITSLEYKSVALPVQKQIEDLYKKLNKHAPLSFPFPNVGNFDPKVTLLSIAEKFTKGNVEEAFAEFNAFEKKYPELAKKVYGQMWYLKGSPQNKHSDFGRVAFHNLEGFSSSYCEKAEAITSLYFSIEDRLQEIVTLFQLNQPVQAIQKFKAFEMIYPNIANSVFKNVWELYGKPAHQNQAHIAHDNFGGVAFYNEHPNPQFKADFAINTKAITNLLPELKNIKENVQLFVEQNIERRKLRCLQVMHETLDAAKKGKYSSLFGVEHNLKDQVSFSIQQSRLYKDGGSTQPKTPRFPSTILELSPQNCVSVAYDCACNGGNTLLLNLANSHHAGGCYTHHIGTQEEEIFRCSTLSVILDKQHGLQSKDFYPIHEKAGPAGGIYSPQVSLIRLGGERDYQLFEKPVEVGVASFAAYNQPKLDFTDKSNPRLTGEELKWTKEKIRTLLYTAYENGHDTLILGAFGCGAFSNPPQHIAELFMEVINTEYKGCFKKIIFSVLEDWNQGKPHNPEGNFVPFARVVLANQGKVYNKYGDPITRI